MPDHSSDDTPPPTRRRRDPSRAAFSPTGTTLTGTTLTADAIAPDVSALTADDYDGPRWDDGGFVGSAAHTTRAPRTDWRLGGSTVRRWREALLATALGSLGLAVLLGTLVKALWVSPWAAVLATAVLWIGMLVPIVAAFRRSRPVGLLRFRALDVLYGVALGLFVRLVQGWLENAAGGSGALPSYPRIDGALPAGWIFTDLIGAVAVAPLIEEFFFRVVVLVAIFATLRRAFGTVAAGLLAVAGSSILFVLVHALTLGLTLDAVASVGLLGLVCGLLVMLTGRIWGAVLVHVVFNATYVALALAGTFLA